MSKVSDNESEEEFHDAKDGSNSAHISSPKDGVTYEKSLDDLIDRTSKFNIPTGDLDESDAEAEPFEEAKKGEEMSKDEMELLEKDMTPEQLAENKEKAEKLKLEGNELFKNDKALEAIEVYTLALNTMPLANTKERSILYANRAAAKIQIDSKKSAVEDCDKSLELWPDYVRCLLRRAKLHESLDDLDEALEDFKKVYELDPGQTEARVAMVRLPPLIEEKRERMKAEVMGKLKDLGNMILKPFGLSTENFQMTKDPNSGGYSINMKN